MKWNKGSCQYDIGNQHVLDHGNRGNGVYLYCPYLRGSDSLHGLQGPPPFQDQCAHHLYVELPELGCSSPTLVATHLPLGDGSSCLPHIVVHGSCTSATQSPESEGCGLGCSTLSCCSVPPSSHAQSPLSPRGTTYTHTDPLHLSLCSS